MADPGSYLLVVDCERPTNIEIGALGVRSFEQGVYVYAGSAFGPGGLGRVDRHRRVANGEHDVRHWHIDYFLGTQAVDIARVETFPEQDVECALATTLGEADVDYIEQFGASDCNCESHLWGPTDYTTVAAVVKSATE